MKVSKRTSIYSFLEPFLAQGPEAVQAARKRYWKEYRVNHRKEVRQRTKTLEIGFTASEWKGICVAARTHKRGRSRLVKQCALAYLQHTFVVPDITAVSDARALLSELLCFIKEKFDEHLLPDVIGKLLMVRIATLADEILDKLEHPKLMRSDS